MHQRLRLTAVTHPDGEAPRVAANLRDEAETHVLAIPRRKRYFTPLDLDAIAPPEAEPNAPTAALDL